MMLGRGESCPTSRVARCAAPGPRSGRLLPLALRRPCGAPRLAWNMLGACAAIVTRVPPVLGGALAAPQKDRAVQATHASPSTTALPHTPCADSPVTSPSSSILRSTSLFFFFKKTAPPEIHLLPLPDPLRI